MAEMIGAAIYDDANAGTQNGRRMQRTGRHIAGRAMNLMNDAEEMVK